MSRISYRNYPTLEMMGNTSAKHNIKVYQEDSNLSQNKIQGILSVVKDTLSEKTKVTSVSKNFVDTVKYSFDKISEIINDEINKEFKTILINESFIIDGFIIHIIQKISNIQFSTKTSVFDKDGYVISTYFKKDYKDVGDLWETKSKPYFFKIGDERYNIAVYFTKLILNIIYFRKHAKVEIIESKAKSKKVVFNCKYLNETNSDIEYLDSKWFTTLINSKGFKVRGFFRMQPKKKNGEWVKELIWIEEFEKKGYVRNAKILNKPKEQE
jgi:hypothetical protein